MPPKRSGQEKRQLVINADDMLLQPFRLHCQTRHAQTMRFRSKGEHMADHRLHQDRLDHVHEEEVNDVSGAGEPDQDSDL